MTHSKNTKKLEENKIQQTTNSKQSTNNKKFIKDIEDIIIASERLKGSKKDLILRFLGYITHLKFIEVNKDWEEVNKDWEEAVKKKCELNKTHETKQKEM